MGIIKTSIEPRKPSRFSGDMCVVAEGYIAGMVRSVYCYSDEPVTPENEQEKRDSAARSLLAGLREQGII